jgi:hypothetical protein
VLIPVQCDPCAESKVACCQMLGAGPGTLPEMLQEETGVQAVLLTYQRVFARQLHTMSNSLPPPVLHGRCAPHAASNMVAGLLHQLCSPPVGKHWHCELECSEAMINLSYCQHNFHHKMLNEALMQCMVLPPNNGPCTKHIKFTSPASPHGHMHFRKCCDKGKCHTALVEEEEPQDKGKGCADLVVSKYDYKLVYSSNVEDWFRL